MPHSHNHPHHHARGVNTRQANRKHLLIVLGSAGAYMIAEVIGGLLTNSLALLADASHMLSDVAALGLSLFAMWIAERPSTPQRTYGYYRAEILAALANGATLVAIAIYIFLEAYQRLRHPPDVQGTLMMWIAVGGLAVNLFGLWILNAGKHTSLNLRGAWLHVFTDALGSVGVIIAGGLIWAFGWNWADPTISILIGLLVIYSSYRLLIETVSILMENAPRGIDVDEVRDALISVTGVQSVHDLHVWTITSGLDSLSAHVVAADHHPRGLLLSQMQTILHTRFGIEHITIQIEPEDFEHPETPV